MKMELDINDPVIPNILKHAGELKKVNLTIAREFNTHESTITAQAFFQNSGLELLRQIIKEEFGEDNIKSCFFEYSTLCSTIGNDILSAFLCVWQKEDHLDTEKLEGDLDHIISVLFAESLSLYYLPKFFIEPDEDKANITILPDLNNRYKDIEIKTGEYLKKFNEAIKKNSEPIKHRPLSAIDGDQNTFVQNLSLHNVDYESVKKKSLKFHNDDPLPNHLLLHYLYDKILYKKKDKNLKTILISIPMLGAPFAMAGNRFNGQGALFLYLITDIKINEEFRKRINLLVENISGTNKDLTYNYLFDVGYRFAKEAKKNSIKAAISQVIDRQMSHNINSHVLANLVTKDNLNPLLIQPFLKYLQTRIEFIADIVTTEPLITFPSSLMDDILSRFINVKTDKVLANTNFEKEEQIYLLKYISGSSEVTYEDADDNKKNINIIFNDDQIKAAIPNDILGAQAFYVILENIIRNSVKHCIIPNEETRGNRGAKLFKKLLALSIKVESFNNDYWKIVIWDNLGKNNSNQRSRTDYKIEDEMNLTFTKWMNKKIDRNVLDKSGKLREGDWGLLEMKICSAYLRKYPLVDLDKKEIFPRLFNITLQDNNIGYEFYLLKPKLACVVFDTIPSDLKIDSLANTGIDIVAKEEIDFNLLSRYGILKKNLDEGGKTSHKYLILEQGVLGQEMKIESNQPCIELTRTVIQEILESEVESGILKIILPNNQVKELVFLDDLTEIPKNLPENNNKVIFHLHADSKMTNQNNPTYLSYYEPYSTQSATGKLVRDYKDATNGIKDVLNYEVNLAAKLDVAILDERIQAEACKIDILNNNQTEGKQFQILKGMKILIPNEKTEFNLNANSFHEGETEQDKISYKIRKWVRDRMKDSDYVLIHQGIIEKTLRSTDIGDIETFVKGFNNEKAKLIIISGRGKPSNLPNDVFYLPFSLVNQYVISYRSKIYLYKLLISARRYRHD